MIVTTDLHWTDKDKDAYRWSIVPWVDEQLSPEEDLFVLGDITDAKDGHSSKLVNAVVEAFAAWVDSARSVVVVMGNHDYIDPERPYFEFLTQIGVTFVKKPTVLLEAEVGRVLALPNTKYPMPVWNEIALEDVDVIVCHQTFHGAKSHNGFELSGVGSRYFSERSYDGLVLSGDIHTAQQCGDVLYVGTPYPVHFGEEHKPRVLRVFVEDSGATMTELFPPTIRKWTVTLDGLSPEFPEVSEGDQLKVKLVFPADTSGYDWKAGEAMVQDWCHDQGLVLASLEVSYEDGPGGSETPAEQHTHTGTPRQILERYVESQGLSESEHAAGCECLDDLGVRP